MESKIGNYTNLTGMKDLLNPDKVDINTAGKIELDILNTDQNKDHHEYHYDDFKQNIDNAFNQLEFNTQMDNTIGSTPIEPENDDFSKLLSSDISTPSNEEPTDYLSDILNSKSPPVRSFKNVTREHNTHRIVEDVLNHHDENDDYINQIEEDDEKLKLLEKIDMLREILRNEQIETSHIKPVDKNSSLGEIESTLKILDRKNNRSRHAHLAEEFIMGFAFTLEDFFDGKKEYFGRKPDLTNWHKTVNTKLMRMRYDTTEVAEGVMEGLGLGPAARIAFELVPSMIVYSRQRSASHNTHAVNEEEVDKAINDITE